MNQLLNYQSYRKENIKSRLIRRAAELWGFRENEIDSFDPLVGMMLEACAVEFEKIGDELSSTRYRIIDRLAALMNPETQDIMKCAHGVIQTQAIDPFTVIMPSEQFFFKKPVGMGINTDYLANEIFFSPIMPFRIFHSRVKYLGTNTSIFRMDKANQRTKIASRIGRHTEPEDYKSLWIGLDSYDAIDSLAGHNFFFDWSAQPSRAAWYNALKRAEWFINGQPLEVEMGLRPEYAEGMKLENEFDALYQMEQWVKAFYDENFVTLGKNRHIRKEDLAKSKLPEELSIHFSKETIQQLHQTVLWIEVRFPTDLDADALPALYCSANCIPVMNRKLHTITYRPKHNLNIVPLESESSFLSVKTITDDRNVVYRHTPFSSLDKVESNTYTVRNQGVGRFDGRNAREMLHYVLELLHDESKAFSAMDSGFLSESIFQLNQNISSLEQKIKTSQSNMTAQGAIPFVIVKPAQPDDNLYIEFWSCDGEMANRIPAGSHLQPHSDVFLQKDEVYLMTTTTGGANRLKETDKINNFKQNLLTRGRLVTHEDIRVACWTLLGDKVRDIRISKNFITSPSPGAGVIRCILIELVPPSRDANADEWDKICKELRVSLEARSAANLPYYVVLGN